MTKLSRGNAINHPRAKQRSHQQRDIDIYSFFFLGVFGTFDLGSDLSAIVVVFLGTLGTRSRPTEDYTIEEREGGGRGEGHALMRLRSLSDVASTSCAVTSTALVCHRTDVVTGVA